MADIRMGTSAFTAAGWETAFYPAWERGYLVMSQFEFGGLDGKRGAGKIADEAHGQ